MKKNLSCHFLIMALMSLLITSCSTNDVDMPEINITDNDHTIEDEALGEYLIYLKIKGVKKNPETGEYYVNAVEAANQTGEININKTANTITKLKTAGLATAEIKIKNVDVLQYFVNITSLTLTSNEVEIIDLTALTKLEVLGLNFNLVGSLDLTKNTELTKLNYKSSGNATDAQKLATIDLSKNTKLKEVDLTGHTGAPFPIPSAIFNQLTVANGVIADDGSGESNEHKIKNEALGEYLVYLNAAGVTEKTDNTGKTYYIDIEKAKEQTGELNLSKSSNAINTLQTAGLTTAATKITDADGLQYFINITGLILTSNEIESIDLTKMTKLETLNLNNNFIGSLDLTKNTELVTFSYTGSSKVSGTQILTSIDLSKNTKLKSVDLTKHANAPFPIPAAIFNNLETAKGVQSDDGGSEVTEYKITNEAFGEYLFYLNAAGVTEKTENSVKVYYIDVEKAKEQTNELNLSKSSNAIKTLQTAGLTTAATKITDVDGLQYFINVTGVVLTSNEVKSIDLTKLVKLETLNLNNNFIGSLDLTKNAELKTLSYTASSKATADQKLTTIDLSKNTKLTSVDLTGHTGAPFTIPAAIFKNLTTAKGVASE